MSGCKIDDCGKSVHGRDMCEMHYWRWKRHGETAPRAKLSDEQVRAIRADPRVQRIIAAEYGIAESHVSRLKGGRQRQTA